MKGYSGVNQGEEMPPVVALSYYWPVMLMIFIGIMTLPTLFFTGFTVARIPTTIDMSTITASIDASSMNQLTAVSASLNTIKNALAITSNNLANKTDTLGGMAGNTGDNANAKGKKHLHLDEDATCSSNDPTTFHSTDRYLVNGGNVVLMKVCAAQCGLKASSKTWIMPGAEFKTTSIKGKGIPTILHPINTYSGQTTVHLNSGTSPISAENYFTNTTFFGLMSQSAGGQTEIEGATVDMSQLTRSNGDSIPPSSLTKWEGFRKDFTFQYTLDQQDTVKDVQIMWFYKARIDSMKRRIKSSDVPTGLSFIPLPSGAVMPGTAATAYDDAQYSCA